MCKYILVLMALFLGFNGYAIDEERIETKLGDYFIVQYNDGSHWVVETFYAQIGHLQDRIDSKYFRSKEEAQAFYRETKVSLIANNDIIENSSGREFVSTEIEKSLWEVKEEWNDQWEIAYSDWVKENFDKDFFVKYNISTDCADVAISLRWIFSRIHFLPAANTLAGSQVLFTQDSFKKEWKSLKRDILWYQDELFLKALKYLLNSSYTGTLNLDTYPIEINKNSFRVGTIHLDGGHTMIISKIDYDQKEVAPIWKLSSTLPPKVRELHEQIMFDRIITPRENGGLLRMRWPVKIGKKWEMIKKQNMPNYSLEQYSEEFLAGKEFFALALFEKLEIDFKPDVTILSFAKSVKKQIEDRVSIVEDGFEFCKSHDCSEGSMNYEVHSTPIRDQRFIDQYNQTIQLVWQFYELYPNLLETIMEFYGKEKVSVLGRDLSITQYYDLFSSYLISSHPSDDITERWGMDSAIEPMLKKRLANFSKRRESLIAKTANCINNENCNFGSSNWVKYNTYDFDHDLKSKIYFPFFKAKSILGTVYKDHNFKKIVLELPFWVSNPKDDQRARWGAHAPQNSYVLKANYNIVQISEENFLLDDKVVNLNDTDSNVSIGLLNNIRIDRGNLRAFGTQNSDLISYDLKNKLRKNIHLSYTPISFYWFGRKHLVASNCRYFIPGNSDEDPCYLTTLRIENDAFEIESELEFEHLKFEVASEFVYENNQTAILVKEKGGGYSILASDKNGDLYKKNIIEIVGDTKVVATKNSFILVTGNKFEVFSNANDSCVFSMDPQYGSLQTNFKTPYFVLKYESHMEVVDVDTSDCKKTVLLKQIVDRDDAAISIDDFDGVGVLRLGRASYIAQENVFRKLNLADNEWVVSRQKGDLFVKSFSGIGGESMKKLNILTNQISEIFQNQRYPVICDSAASPVVCVGDDIEAITKKSELPDFLSNISFNYQGKVLSTVSLSLWITRPLVFKVFLGSFVSAGDGSYIYITSSRK